MSDHDPTQNQSDKVARFSSRRFDHIDRKLEAVARENKLLGDLLAGLSECLTRIETRLAAGGGEGRRDLDAGESRV